MFLDFLGIVGVLTDLTITMCRGIYEIFSYVYEIFLKLCTARIFDNSEFNSILTKIEIILGVIMLFVLAYQALLLIIDPDKDKGGATTEKFLKNIIITFILIVTMPAIFDFAFQVHDVIIEKGVITGIFSGANSNFTEESIKDAGNQAAGDAMAAFFYSSEGLADKQVHAQETRACTVKGTKYTCAKDKCTLEDAKTLAHIGCTYVFYSFEPNINDTIDSGSNNVSFPWLICLIAGFYLLYVMISYCFDMAVRIAKLAFYELVAPIALVFRIIPKKEGVFKTWMSSTIKTFTSSLIHIFIAYLTMFMLALVDFSTGPFDCKGSACTLGVKTLSYAFYILGLFTFMRKVPNEIDKLFGLDADIKLGIRDKFKEGVDAIKGFTTPARTALSTTTGAVGGTLVSGIRNAKHGWENVKNAKESRDKIAAAARGIGSTILGSAQGGFKGGTNGSKNIKLKDQYGNIINAANTVTNARTAHEESLETYGDRGPIRHTISRIPILGETFASIDAQGREILGMTGKPDGVAGAVKSAKGVKDTARELFKSDADKNKDKDYGLTEEYTFASTALSGVKVNYNTAVYKKIMDAVNNVKNGAGDQVVTFKNSDGVDITRTITSSNVADLDRELGKFVENAAQAMANAASVSNVEWNSQSKLYQKELNDVRVASNNARKEMITNFTKEFVDKLNKMARELQEEEWLKTHSDTTGLVKIKDISMEDIRNGKLDFDNTSLKYLSDVQTLIAQEKSNRENTKVNIPGGSDSSGSGGKK